MQKLNIDLEHCYGIKKFKEKLDFSQFSVIAIYASNGTMKTSFANTFRDLSDGMNSKDNIFPDRKTVRIIKDEKNEDVIKENVFVIEPYNEDYNSEKISTLLVDKKLQNKHSEIYKKIDKVKNKFLNELGSLAGLTHDDIERKISKSFSNNTFFDILKTYETVILETKFPKFPNIKHNAIFNDRVLDFLDISDFKRQIKEYVEKYNSLLDTSEYLKPEFDHYNASRIQTSLANNGFFDAKHSINLNNGTNQQEITKVEDLEAFIQKEKERILKDPELLKKWNDIDNKLSANNELRSFREYLHDNKEILAELGDLEKFSRDIWLSYFIVHKNLFIELLDEYKKGEKDIEKIVEKAKKTRNGLGKCY